ncbi:hypothetical protein AXG93_406s1100 [Marchantia polymorpha subsp. ruderalis]|uniref:Reverse transcriptase Ty1/copia-type domain-containing protein n=1 Tax=Marchantia polymorpha subsp. ruderalis TaxID=1480154 RepID=A0A176VCA1_MARPO|nr:hypothetical protein AXG93_406s1100 [Marchantia polymorpha subsp. ruderalis]
MSSLERGVELVPIVAECAGTLYSDDESEESSFLSEDLVEVIPERLQPIKPMTLSKVGGPRFEVKRFDGRTDYLLWERQVKNVIKAMSLGKVLKRKPLNVDDKDWNEIQYQALMIFKMVEGTKIKDHIDAFNDLLVDLLNLGEDLSDEKKSLQLLSSLPASYHTLSRLLLHRDKESITYNEVVTALLTDNIQQMLVSSSTPSSYSTALYVTCGRLEKRSTSVNKSRNHPSQGKWKAQVETQIGEKVKFLRSDNEHAVRDEYLLVDDLGEALITEDESPFSYAKSQSVPKKLEWNVAMRKEMESLHDNQTWELVELPNGKRAIDCKWVYTVKDGSTNAVKKIFKARLVANGFK